MRHARCPPGRRLDILDFKLPERAPDWLVDLGVWIMRLFVVTRDPAERHPWESVETLRGAELDEQPPPGLRLCRGRGGARSLTALKGTRS